MVEQMTLFEGKEYTVADANPRSQTVKSMEMTVLRAIQLIAAFEALDSDQDWWDVPGSTYRKIIGERYEYPLLLSVCFDRWKRGTLYQEVLDLAANLPPASLEREEIKDGLQSIRDHDPGVPGNRPRRDTGRSTQPTGTARAQRAGNRRPRAGGRDR